MFSFNLRKWIYFNLAIILAISVATPLWSRTITHGCLDRQEVYGRTTTIFHGAAVEPSIAVNPKNKNHIVAVWQQDRISNGGALNAGISYSNDGGKTWHKSHVPFQVCLGGISQRSGDDWLSYSADGSRVYLCASVLNATQEPDTVNQWGVVLSISKDNGATWSEPRFLFSSMDFLSDPTQQFANSDKTSITADPNNPKRAIAVWATFNPSASAHGNAQSSYTEDGGKTWSAVQQIYDPFPDLTQQGLSNGIQNDNQASNNVVVILPKKCKEKERLNGDWLDFTVRVYAKPGATDMQYTNDTFPLQYTLTDIAMVRSKNHGKNWEPNATVVVPSFVNNLVYTGGYTYDLSGNITGGIGSLMRNDQTVPSYNVNHKNGFLYVAYQSGEFRSDQLQQIGLVTSRDGGHTWSNAVQVNRTPALSPNPQAVAPFVAVTNKGRVGILYFDFRNDDRSDVNNTKMDAWLVIYQEVKDPQGGSTGIGLDFVEEIRLSEESYIAQNGALTTIGYMTDSDYVFLAAQCDDFYAIYTKSFNGPFNPPIVYFSDPANNATVLLDDNLRTAPYVSIVRNRKNGASLISTTRLH